MENLGYLALILAFCLSIYAILASLTGKLRRNVFLEVSAQRAVLAAWVLVTVASGSLLYLILTNDFRISYVASRSNVDLPLIYKFAAWWGGQEGSLLFWTWILASYSFIAVYTARKKHAGMISYVVAIMMSIQVFFLLLIVFIANPFQVLMSGPQITSTPDGQGLNPLLQHPLMAIHPPMLYLGFVGFAVPFAFAMASLITRQRGDSWIHTTRIWTMITWLFQSIGVLLGARWAYAVLGWGRLLGLGPRRERFVVAVDHRDGLPALGDDAGKEGHDEGLERRPDLDDLLPVYFRPMMTRSGIVSSVHAFAQSPIGNWFVGFLTISIALTIYLILNRLDYLKSESQLESVVSPRVELLVQQRYLAGQLLCRVVGNAFSGNNRSRNERKDQRRPPVF